MTADVLEVSMVSGPERIYSRRPDIVTVNLGVELALLDLPTGSYLGFNATAAHVWRLLSVPRTLAALCDAMTAEFEVEWDLCRAEVADLLDRLLAANLVSVADA
jgi:hypothetical protein